MTAPSSTPRRFRVALPATSVGALALGCWLVVVGFAGFAATSWMVGGAAPATMSALIR